MKKSTKAGIEMERQLPLYLFAIPLFNLISFHFNLGIPDLKIDIEILVTLKLAGKGIDRYPEKSRVWDTHIYSTKTTLRARSAPDCIGTRHSPIDWNPDSSMDTTRNLILTGVPEANKNLKGISKIV